MGRKKRKNRRRPKNYFSESKHHGGHFIIPESFGGTKTKENVYTKWAGHNNPPHIAYHTLFSDSLPEEAILRIRFWTRKDGRWNMRFFRKPNGEPNNREKARKILFGDMTPEQAIAWIEREFIRKEWLRDN